MKGVVLAGGLGTRLYPLTFATNKHLLPIYDKPMVFYPIQTLVKAGIKDIMVVVGGPHAGHFVQVLRNGKELGVMHLEFAYQEKEGGIAEALTLAEDFSDGGPTTVILGDNTTDADIATDIKNFATGALLFLKVVEDPQRFGIAVFSKNDPQKIIAIEEKPQAPKSKYAVTGLYVYDNEVFSFIKKTSRSKRGELEITDVNNMYIQNGKLNWVELKGFWSDAGTFKSLFNANRYWAEKSG
ncbi:NTP transferase domain-containing protein [Candidatus Gottesmanbacteria bacterium]|nr:NTP transferase domain-containing protein [Candidatus Gottesmanbacteria bacterium]